MGSSSDCCPLFSIESLVGPPAEIRDLPCSQFHTVLESVPIRAASDTVDGRCFVGMLQYVSRSSRTRASEIFTMRAAISHGQRVVEVNRPDRAERRRTGKSDPIDAYAAARAALSGRASSAPKDDTVAGIRACTTPPAPR
jgi:hypothetical protein